KTRLALAAAEQLAEDTTAPKRFPDGVPLVDLTPIRDPALVLGAIARAMGLLDTGSRPLLERLVEALAERRQLVVLDNFEQVLPAATQLAELLAACPGLALLVTSRVPLRLRWEQTLRLAPLPVPDLRAALPSWDALLAVPSVKLFVERARARRANFTYTEKEVPMVAQLAVQLDGLPLALELAAARLDVLSLSVLTRRLGDRLQLLTSEAPDLPERQRSLEAAVGWSCELLSAPERRLFRCLGVFVGRVSLDAIAAVVTMVAATGPQADDGDARDAGRTLYRLLSLAEKSLVLPLPVRPADLGWQHGGQDGQGGRPGQPGQQRRQVQCGGIEDTDEATDDGEDEEDPEPAFGMLETVREYAWKRLTALGELEAARRAHARYFTVLAERADPLLHGCDQRAWYFRLEREHDNLRAALRWLLDQQDDPSERERALQLAGALGWFWYTRGNHREGVRWLEEALARVPAAEVGEAEVGSGAEGGEAPYPEHMTVRTRALVAAGRLLTEQSELARARAVLEEALTLAERRHDSAAMAEVHTYLGLSAITAGEVAEGTRLLQAALHRWEALGDPEGVGKTRFFLGSAADTTGDASVAASSYTDALRWLEAAGDAHLAGHVRCYLGALEWRRGATP
ncbi:MAG TPA: hypothetical protein VGS80_21335, partial [Ktedonobacterales bacterium]|nr:hypothetical protein [Ktedonobacterales bacterium]